MKGILSNPNIAPHIKESVLAYEKHHLLANFYTTFIYHKKFLLSRALSFIFPKLINDFKRRSFDEVSYKLVKTKPYQELIRVFAARKLSALITDKIWEINELNFDRWVAKKLNSNLAFAHLTEHAALETIKKALQLGITTFYEQSSVHHQLFSEIISKQILKYPEFDTNAIKLLTDDNSLRRNKRRDEELYLTDFIICNSTFTMKSLIKAGINEQTIINIPLGFPAIYQRDVKQKKIEKLIFLAAGNLSLGKGTHILLEAWKELNLKSDVAELWFVGKNNLPDKFIENLPDNIKLIDNIPRKNLLEMYTKVDVLIHPTLSDGFGMVISEAMSRGLPVITTYNSAGPDLIIHEVSGLLIEADSKTAIIDSINWCLDHKERLSEIGNKAIKRAESYPWSAYRENLINNIKGKLNK